MSFDLSTEDAAQAVSLLPLGFHLVTIVEADGSEKSSGGYPQIALRVESATGDGLRDWKVITEGSAPFILQLTDAAGIERDKMTFDTPEEGAEKIAAMLLNKQVGVKVEEEPKRNDPSKMRRIVASYWAPSELPAAALQGNADVPADTTGLTQQGSQVQDDDIPF